jgi:hypothetical protein
MSLAAAPNFRSYMFIVWAKAASLGWLARGITGTDSLSESINVFVPLFGATERS